MAPRVRGLEDLIQFLQRTVLCFHKEQEDEECLECIPSDVEEVKFPRRRTETDRRDVLVKETRNTDKETVDSHSFRSGLEVEAFNRVQSLERSKSNGEREPKEVDHRDGSVGARLVGGPVECLDGGAAQAYLDQADVRAAIHVPSVDQIGPWELCTNKLQYTSNWGSLLPYYKDQIIPFIRVLIFNGDADCCVPYNGNEWWTSTLGIPEVTGWTEWTVNSQVAGYVTKYQYGFEFVTVKGAGHMVPEYKPVQALEMISRYFANTCC